MKTKPMLLAATLMAGGACDALADTYAIYELPNSMSPGESERYAVYLQDESHVRLEPLSQGRGDEITIPMYQIKTDQGWYLINKSNGAVARASSLTRNVESDLDNAQQTIMAKMRERGIEIPEQAFQQEPPAEEAPLSLSYSDLNRTQAVAGVPGHVFKFSAEGESVEAIVTDDARVTAVFNVFSEGLMASHNASSPSFGEVMTAWKTSASKTGYPGLLDSPLARLTKLGTVTKPDAFYAIPGNAKMTDSPGAFFVPGE
ncbi:hypothetical protein QQM79_15000 [Marinobacteraceae bacterium S3BR75-40.1]